MRQKPTWWRTLGLVFLSSIAASVILGLTLAFILRGSSHEDTAMAFMGVTAIVVLSGIPRPHVAFWRVPRRGLFFGHPEGLGAVFGGALGSMFLTELPSYGAIALAAWALLAAEPETAAVAFGCFGLARALPIATAALSSYRNAEYPAVYSNWYRASIYLGLPEALLIGLVALDLR